MGHELTEQDVRTLRRLKHKVDNIRGEGVTNTPDGVIINSGSNGKKSKNGAPHKFPLSLMYQVWMQIDMNGTWGPSWPRFH